LITPTLVGTGPAGTDGAGEAVDAVVEVPAACANAPAVSTAETATNDSIFFALNMVLVRLLGNLLADLRFAEKMSPGAALFLHSVQPQNTCFLTLQGTVYP
jgi:hypothetical protein